MPSSADPKADGGVVLLEGGDAPPDAGAEKDLEFVAKRKRGQGITLPGSKRKRGSASAAVVDIESASDSGTSSSSSSGTQRRTKRVGAVAATALITSQKPLDIEEAEKMVERDLELPTSFAARFHHEGGLVAIMVDTTSDISLSPSERDKDISIVHILGTEHSVGRAASQLELAFQSHIMAEELAADDGREDHLMQLDVEKHLQGRLIKNGGALIAKVRESHGGIMIAVQPPAEPGGPMTVVIGPGKLPAVKRAQKALQERLDAPEEAPQAAPKSLDAQKAKPGLGEPDCDAEDYECVD